MQFVLEVDDAARSAAFEEFDGASYFILQNLVRNAMDAVTTQRPRLESGCIVTFSIKTMGEGGALALSGYG